MVVAITSGGPTDSLRELDFSLPRPFAPGSESSRCGTFGPWNFCTLELLLHHWIQQGAYSPLHWEYICYTLWTIIIETSRPIARSVRWGGANAESGEAAGRLRRRGSRRQRRGRWGLGRWCPPPQRGGVWGVPGSSRVPPPQKIF